MARHSPFLTVLIVEDEALFRWALVETLTEAGFQTLEARDGAAAIRAAAPSNAIDVMLLDLWLPDSNAIDLLATLRRLAPATAIIAMTAHDDRELTNTALRLGADRVLKKPIDMRDVPTVVAHAHACRPI
jgi:DNA-binding response OmpR family regulator